MEKLADISAFMSLQNQTPMVVENGAIRDFIFGLFNPHIKKIRKENNAEIEDQEDLVENLNEQKEELLHQKNTNSNAMKLAQLEEEIDHEMECLYRLYDNPTPGIKRIRNPIAYSIGSLGAAARKQKKLANIIRKTKTKMPQRALSRLASWSLGLPFGIKNFLLGVTRGYKDRRRSDFKDTMDIRKKNKEKRQAAVK